MNEIPDLEPYIKKYISEDKYNSDFEAMVREFHNKAFLTKAELVRIAEWKLRGSYWGKHKKEIERNSDSDIKKITGVALSQKNDGDKIIKLNTISGVNTGVASTILTILNPDEYAIIDVNVWHAIYEENKKPPFSVADFLKYMEVVRTIKNRRGLTAREVDMGLFALGKETRRKKRK